MYMAFEGIFGRTWARGFRGELVEASDATDGDFLGGPASEAILVTASGTALGRGGGKGDIEMLLTEAVCA